jgi:septal ring factor EnvC (AmiA/AmiB activator)
MNNITKIVTGAVLTAETIALIYNVKQNNSLTSELDKSKETLSSTKQELVSTNKTLESTKQTLASTKEELASTNQELESTNQTLESTNQELESTNQTLASTKEELAAANKTINKLTPTIQNLVESVQVDSYDKLSSLIECIIWVGEYVNVIEDNDVKTYPVKQEHSARVKSIETGRVTPSLIQNAPFGGCYE